MKISKTSSALTLIAMLFFGTASTYGDILNFTWSGNVGSDAGAVGGVTGIAWGNESWSYDGLNLAAGTEIIFDYSIDAATIDGNASSTTGVFSGGTFSVSIPTLGVADVASLEAYNIVFEDGINDDVISAGAADGSGFAIVGLWSNGSSPWPDPNTLSTIADPGLGELFGTAPAGNFDLQLANGLTLTTGSGFTELLTNESFSSSLTAVPEPSSLAIVGVLMGGMLFRRRR